MNAGAIPKLTKSVKESNSLPNSDVPFINLAILPSKASSNAANTIKVTAREKLPSNENFINPIKEYEKMKLQIEALEIELDETKAQIEKFNALN